MPNKNSQTIVSEVLHGYHILFFLNKWGEPAENEAGCIDKKKVVFMYHGHGQWISYKLGESMRAVGLQLESLLIEALVVMR